ncbi:MAG: type II toxin-antitoxin system Phd/YefM family antitoxin [Magnetococcales bacterium]|nr:type II toxin-antitoxin system Phd/YefM family antitoxin [Magnetococcales bacterium]
MEQINMAEAQDKFSDLVRRAASGEEITITENGIPQAKLVPLSEPKPQSPRVPGLLKGLIQESEDFDQTPEDVIALFG